MRILVVEDERELAIGLRAGLSERGYAVDLAADGEEALDFVAVADYDLIVLDLMLPRVDGLTVCERVRSRRIQTPILILTARDAVEDRVAGLDRGADDYLTKPFAFQELLARVRALLRREGATRDPILRFADLEVDTRARSVRRGDQSIDLGRREFSILEYLLRNCDQVLTREQIAEHVWDYDFTALSNVVDVHVYTLRCKIDRPFERKLLYTVWGVGYQLRAPRE